MCSLAAGTHGFENTKFMWDTGHFKTLLDLDEYAHSPLERPYDPATRTWAKGRQVCAVAPGARA